MPETNTGVKKSNQKTETVSRESLQPIKANLPATMKPEKIVEALGNISQDIASVNWINGKPQKRDRLLVVIQQMHNNGAIDLDKLKLSKEERADLEKQFKAVPQCQKEIEKIIRHFVDQGGLSKVHLENMDPKKATQYASYPEQLKKFSEFYEKYQVDLIKAGFPVRNSEETEKFIELAKAKKIPANFIEDLSRFRDYQALREIVEDTKKTDGTYRVVAEGKIKLIGPEDPILHQENLDYALAHPNTEIDKDPKAMALMNKRDVHYVKTAGQQKEAVYLIVLGKGHSLKDEVQAWNKQNPKNLIRLAEVIPKTVEEIFGK